MKKYFFSVVLMMTILLQLQAQYGTNWMHNVKSWDVKITLQYKDSANPGNFTKIEFTATGTITNEMMPAGGRMSWPLTADPMQMKQLTAKGTFSKRVTDDMPEPNKVEQYSCSGTINEKILGALATTFNNTYAVNLQMPLVPQITCSGKGAPVTESDLGSMNRDNGIEPTDSNVLTGNCGSNRQTLSGNKSYTTNSGAKVKISWVYTPLAAN